MIVSRGFCDVCIVDSLLLIQFSGASAPRLVFLLVRRLNVFPFPYPFGSTANYALSTGFRFRICHTAVFSSQCQHSLCDSSH